mgnify:CR=1 FL=1
MKLDIEEVKKYISNTSENTKIYIGGDSVRFRKRMENGKMVWHARYSIAVVIHHDGNKGCKIFGGTEVAVDYDQKKARPAIRLMGEVYKISEVYLQLAEAIGERSVELHMDLNQNEIYGSSCVVSQAISYIRGMCNIIPKVKPNAPAATYAADRIAHGM